MLFRKSCFEINKWKTTLTGKEKMQNSQIWEFAHYFNGFVTECSLRQITWSNVSNFKSKKENAFLEQLIDFLCSRRTET